MHEPTASAQQVRADEREAPPVGVAPAVGPKRKRPVRRAFKFGCLGLLLALCGVTGALVYALQSGPVTLHLLGGNTLRLGSDPTVLSNYSFQNGTTYYFDWNGNDVRDILELHYLSDTHRIELVFHYADRSQQAEHNLGSMNLP